MPSTSSAQAKLMSAIAHGWHAPMKHAPSMVVAREFHEADKRVGKYMHAEGGKVGGLSNIASSWRTSIAGGQAALQPYRDELNAAVNSRIAGIKAAGRSPAESTYMDLSDPDAVKQLLMSGAPLYADGGKVGTLVNFAKQGTKALMDRLEGAFSNPYTADTEQVRNDISKYWRTNAPPPKITPPEPQLQKIDTSELDELASKLPNIPGLAEGGAVDDAPKSTRFLGLVRHAADRTTAAVSDDPHHALARVAAGLSSQVAGLSPSGHAQFGAMPGLVNETLSLPAGLTDIGKGVADLGGAVADRLPAMRNAGGNAGVAAVQAIRDGLNRLQEKYGDLAPKWSRDAEARSTQLHNAVHQDMGLSDPRGAIENGAEAGGMMLGQVPIPGAEAKEASTGLRGTLGLLKHAIPEWLGPTIRPSVKNYGAGTLAGGLLGAAGSGADDSRALAPDPDNSSGMKEQFE
jgi:hypothetical protein